MDMLPPTDLPRTAEDGGRIGVMLCGHGSRDERAVAEFAALAERLPAFLPESWEVAHGYLEFANPVIRDGLDRLREAGCTRIYAVPGMLFAAMHTKNDVPTVLARYAAEHGIEITMGRELGIDAHLLAAAGDRVREAMAAADAASGPVPPEETCLVVIGRGASDPDANGNVAKLARMLWEGMGFGWCEVGYSGVTFPLVQPTLEHAAKLGYRRIVVFPYMLFTGILVDRIYGFTDRVATAHPGIEFVKAGYLNDHPEVMAAFVERIMEQMGEAPPPSCAMCKYRTRILGFEEEVGTPQESHHHHVEGQGASAPGSNVAACTLCDDFCTGECRLEMAAHHHHHHDDEHHHHHHHHHHRYPHADHPLGPVSVRRSKR